MLLLQALRMLQRINKRKKRSVAEKPSVKRNALARKPVGKRVTIKTIGRVVETNHDRGLPLREDWVTERTAAAGHLPATARSAVIG